MYQIHLKLRDCMPGNLEWSSVHLCSHNSSVILYWICLIIYNALRLPIWVSRNVIDAIRRQHKAFAYVSFKDTYTSYMNCLMWEELWCYSVMYVALCLKFSALKMIRNLAGYCQLFHSRCLNWCEKVSI